MKRQLLTGLFTVTAAFVFGQAQIGNSGFENWESVSGGSEPVNWNSFLTAGGTWAWAADDQMAESSDVRPGSTGTKSCFIWSRSTFGIIANGNVTLGKINMGSTTPTDAANYNFSQTANTSHSEVLTDMPDSIVFWAKFIPNGHSQNARMKATLHDAYDYRDPEDATSLTHVVATAESNYAPTAGQWERFSVAFDYSGPASTVAYILLTFTTNQNAGGGAADDEVYIDDVELIYNPASLAEKNTTEVFSFLSNGGNTLNFKSEGEVDFIVFDLSGKQVMSGTTSNAVDFSVPNGVYIVRTSQNGVLVTNKVTKY
jgi:hypothetical protein